MEVSPVHARIGQLLAALEKRHQPALVAEIVRQLGYAAESSLTATLRVMETRRLIEIQGGASEGKPRTIVLTPSGRQAFGVGGGLPLLGSIPAGPLSEAIAHAELLELKDLLPYREGDFLLRVRGDSMTGDGILDGDKVLLRPGAELRPGEIAAVQIGDAFESTLKRVHFQPNSPQITLRASNPKYPDIIVPARDVRIAGVFRGLIRHDPGP